LVYVHPDYLHLNEYDIEDIAHHLALENRWNGATEIPMSVAQHSVIVGRLSGLIEGFGHDFQEYMLKDIPRPVKAILPGYREIEDAMQQSIAEWFGWANPKNIPIVKWADNMAIAQEKRDICKPHVSVWDLPEPVREILEPLDWRKAEQLFLDEWEKMYRG
jgi:hypothetical protein